MPPRCHRLTYVLTYLLTYLRCLLGAIDAALIAVLLYLTMRVFIVYTAGHLLFMYVSLFCFG